MAEQLNHLPEFPTRFDSLLGLTALAAALGSEVATKPAAKWALFGISMISAAPFIHKALEYDGYFGQDALPANLDGNEP